MSKKLIGLLLAVALVIGLLPAMALAAEAKTAKLGILSWSDIEVTQGGEAKYLKNSEYQGYNEDGEKTSMGYTQVAGTAEDWNVKFEWKAGEAGPTLTFKDAKLDHQHDDGTDLWKEDSSAEDGYKKVTDLSAILPKGSSEPFDLKIVLQGNNLIEVDTGFIRGGYETHVNNITIVGEEGSNLTMKPGTYGTQVRKDCNLTLENVTATVTSGAYAPFSVSGKGVLTVNNCNLNLTAGNAPCLGAGWFPKDADGNIDTTPTIVINDSNLNLHTTKKGITGCINNGAWGTAVANNSTIVAVGDGVNAAGTAGGHAYWGGGLTLNNCDTNFTSASSHAVHLDDGSNPNAALKVNGGTIEITAAGEAVHANNANAALPVDVSGNITWTAKVGDTKEAAAAVTDATKLTGKYVQIIARVPGKAAVRLLSWIDMIVEEGGEAVYLKNSEYQGYNEDGEATYKGWTQVAGDKDNWNAKFEYPIGGVPTLTLKDVKLDMIGDDGKALYKADASKENGVASQGSISAIISKTGYFHDLKVVLQGANHIEANNGIIRGTTTANNYFEDITIVGEKDSSLYGRGGGIGIGAANHYNLTVNGVTADLGVTSNQSPLQAKGNATITVKNSNLTTTTTKAPAISGARADKIDANIVITGSTLNMTRESSSSTIAGILNNSGYGVTTVTDSTINATAVKCGFYWGSGLTLNNCTTNVTCDNIAVRLDAATTPTATLKVNGGTAEIFGATTAVANVTKENTPVAVDVSGSPVWSAKVGDTKETAADVTDATKLTGKYVYIEATPFSAATVTVAGVKMELKAFDTPVYLKNASAEAIDIESNKFTYWYPVAGTAEDWNIKYEWKTGEAGPVLTLNGAKIDDYNETSGKWRARVDGNGVIVKDKNGNNLSVNNTAFLTAKLIPLTVTITGENSQISTYFGINYKGNILVQSEGNATLIMDNRYNCLSSGGTKKASLTLNANLDLSVQAYYDSNYCGVIQNYKNSITILGGNISIENYYTKGSMLGILSRGDDENCNIYIKGGNIVADAPVGTGGPNGTIKSEGGYIIIDGGNVSVTSKKSTGFFATKGVVINGGTVKSVSPFMGIYSASEDTGVTVNGGTLEMIVESDVVDYYVVNAAPILGKGMGALVSKNNASDAVPYDGTNYLGHYIKVAAGLTPPDQVNPGTDSTTGTEAPSTGTDSTTGTQAPTQDTTAPAKPNPGTGDNSFLAVWMGLMVVSAAAFVCIAMGKKKVA